MKDELLIKLQGEEVYISQIVISFDNFDKNLLMRLTHNDLEYSITFINPSRISLNNISFPLNINGFEILSKKSMGWDNPSLYYVHDFEDNQLSFYCEQIEVAQ